MPRSSDASRQTSRRSTAKASAKRASKSSATKSTAKKPTKKLSKKSAAKSAAPKKSAAKKGAAKRTAPKRTPAGRVPTSKAKSTRSSVKATSAAKSTKSSSKAKRPSTRSPFPAKWLSQQEKALREERQTYAHQFESLRAEADSLVADYEPGDVQFDEESGEGDTLSIERERDLTLSSQAQQMVEEIDTALAKLANGTYGICEVSGEPIPKERLEAIPWARVRVEYKTGGLASRQ